MTTDVDICNFALTSLGLEPIDTLEDATQNARICKRFYALMRDVYLSEHEWSFTENTIELTKIDPLPDGYSLFDYGYQYPSDCLKPRNVRDGETRQAYPFILQNYIAVGPVNTKIILTNLDDAFLEYTIGIVDPGLFSQTFLDALSSKLAFKIAFPLTKDQRVQKQAFDQWLLADATAKERDSSGEMPLPPSQDWIQARAGGTVDPERYIYS